MSMISEQIRTLRDVAQAFENSGVSMLLREAANVIEELSAKLQSANMERSSQYYNNGWIPIGQYPTEPVLLRFENGSMAVGCYDEFDDLFINVGDSFYLASAEPIAWQPLPEPYNPESEG